MGSLQLTQHHRRHKFRTPIVWTRYRWLHKIHYNSTLGTHMPGVNAFIFYLKIGHTSDVRLKNIHFWRLSFLRTLLPTNKPTATSSNILVTHHHTSPRIADRGVRYNCQLVTALSIINVGLPT